MQVLALYAFDMVACVQVKNCLIYGNTNLKETVNCLTTYDNARQNSVVFTAILSIFREFSILRRHYDVIF